MRPLNLSSIMNLHDCEVIRSNNRFIATRDQFNADINIKTRDLEFIKNINILFSQFHEKDLDLELLLQNIYRMSLDIQIYQNVLNYFVENFPFQPILAIFGNTPPPSPDILYYVWVCLATTVTSSNFPIQFFENPEVLTELCNLLDSEPNLSDSALQLMNITVKHSIQSRDFLLQNNIIAKLRTMPQTFSLGEFLESLCSLSPPPPAEIVQQIAEFLSHLIDGSETQILELALSALLSLLSNGAEGIYADQFQEPLIPILISDIPSLAPHVLSILLLTQNPSPEFAKLFLQILSNQEEYGIANNPAVLIRISQLFANFRDQWAPFIGDEVFTILQSRIGKCRFTSDVEIIKTLILYFTPAYVSDLNFFATILRFCDTKEIGLLCLQQILAILQLDLDANIFPQIMSMIENYMPTFIQLQNSDNDDMADMSDLILAQIEKLTKV